MKTLEEYLKEPYSRVLVPDNEGGGYSAEIAEFPGCLASGDTAIEALTNLEEVAREWITSELEQGHKIPAPASEQEYSGKVVLRLPRSLHRQAARLAELDGTSMNQFLVAAVAEKIGVTKAQRGQPPVRIVISDSASDERWVDFRCSLTSKKKPLTYDNEAFLYIGETSRSF